MWTTLNHAVLASILAFGVASHDAQAAEASSLGILSDIQNVSEAVRVAGERLDAEGWADRYNLVSAEAQFIKGSKLKNGLRVEPWAPAPPKIEADIIYISIEFLFEEKGTPHSTFRVRTVVDPRTNEALW